MEVVSKVDDAVALDKDVHWFCPRNGDDDATNHFDDDLIATDPDFLKNEHTNDKNERHNHIDQAHQRVDLILDACIILAYDGEDARPYQEKLKNALAKQLIRCDICIREYHKARAKLKTKLEGQYDTDDVQTFLETFDRMNKERICTGLDNAKQKLLELPAAKRNINNVGNDGMYALFEALHCIPFLQDERALERSFDETFQLVQTNKGIKLPNFSPGMASFLFSSNATRSAWAIKNCKGLKRVATSSEFDDSIKPFLEAAINRVHIVSLDEAFIPTFWSSTRIIFSKLSPETIATKLRSLDANIWLVSLEHFQLNLPHLSDLLASYQILLEKGPKEFWDAMGAISPQTILDTIFAAPGWERMMREDSDIAGLQEGLSWVPPFLSSIKANNLVQPTRTLLHQMFKKLQDNKFPHQPRALTYKLGLDSLLHVLQLMRDQGTNGPVVPQLMELMSAEYIKIILLELDGVEKKTDAQLSEQERTCLRIVELLLALDCRSIAADRSTIIKTATIDHELTASGLSIWKATMRTIKPGHPHVASSIVNGIQGLLGLEPLAKRQVEAGKKPADNWNKALDRAHSYVITDLMDRLQSLTSDQMQTLFDSATSGLFALLFSGQDDIHAEALNLFKLLSGEDGRRGSLLYVARYHLQSMLHSIASAQRTIAKARGFAPCPNMLKLCSDLFSCLCDDSDGVLRSGRAFEKSDLVGLENVWQFSWINLNVIFEMTEAWSNLGYDKRMMQDFCRATMDLADYVFDQYALIASVTESISGHAQQRLLEKPKAVFTNVVKWLRLRDDYLIDKAVKLICKMLGRFKDADIRISEHAATAIEHVFVGKTKTKLSMNHKADVQRSLERHLGESFADLADPIAQPMMKQSSLQGWTSSAPSSGRSTPVQTSKPAKPGTIDVNAWSAAAKKTSTTQDAHIAKVLAGMPRGTMTERAAPPKHDQKKMNEFKLKRQREKEEAARQRADAIARQGGSVGIGSGVIGLGNIGKDHNLKGQNVMVSSDEASSSSDDDLDEDLFGSKIKEDKQRKSGVDLKGVVGLKPEQKKGPTRIQRTQRSVKDMRARLAPDLKPLHRIILSWDFFYSGDYPPGANEHQFRQVANVFHDPSSYQQTFQPLLTLEAWQGVVRAREESSSKPYEIKIVSRSTVDGFIEVSSSVSQADNRDLGLAEGDIVLLSTSRKPMDDSEAPHRLARIYRMKRQKGSLETVYQLMPGSNFDRSVTTQAIIYGLKVQSIVPLEREYGALQALQYYDLCNQIVRAKPSERITFSEKQITSYQDNWNVNRAQSEAINAALTNEGFSLIQGPPGSGKTKTIVAIVGGLLSGVLGSPSRATKINVPGQNDQAGTQVAAKKLLVCAPSNAAVDELVIRLKQGVKTRGGREWPINVVRIGRSDAINAQVQDVTMEALVDKRLGNGNDDSTAKAKAQEIFTQHSRVSAELKDLYHKRENGELTGKEASELQEQIIAVRRRKNELGNKIDNVKDQEKNAGREAELNRKRAQQAILNQAHVICATLSGSGHDMFQSLNIEFETVIIDEAAQCVEMSSLIPLKYGCVKCIMVGDPKQLPPTVFSKEAARFSYEQSLFVRMQNNFSTEVHLLDTQYRMHPDISIFPSRTFYDGLLKDGASMASLRQRPWHASELLAPYRFFDVHGQHQAAPKGHSLINLAEIEIAIALYTRLRTDFTDYDFTSKIGIITPYKSQLRALKDRFSSRFGNDIFDTIDFNTTDAFQGRESEIIIFSCVRASPAGSIGFLQDIRRMNVGLTRAKSSLWVLGNSDSLVRGEYWKKLVEDARARDCYTTGDIQGMLKRPSSMYKAQGGKDTSMHDMSTHTAQMKQTAPKRDIKVETNGHGTSKVEIKVETDDDRMEGIRYRFDDRIKKKRAAESIDGRPTRQRVDEDVEMADAGVQESDTNRKTSRIAESKPDSSRSHDSKNGVTASKPEQKAPQQPRPVKYRPPADPFIRRKAR